MFVETRKEITKEQFDYLKTCDLDDFHDYILNIAMHSAFHPAGYSFISPKIINEDDKYYVSWQHYDSCD